MLHELILALSGYPGSIFVKNRDGEIHVVDDLPFVHPTETALLNRLCRLASHYNHFMTFIQKHGHSPCGVDTSDVHGLYLKAVCQGLDNVLDPYRETLLDLEKQLLADPHLTAAHLQSALEEYQILFPALTIVLREITQRKAHGCYILEILHNATVNGIPKVKQAMHRILHVCHGVLYKQLAGWMLHGLLLDQYNEFFIQLMKKGSETSAPLQVDDDELGLSGVTGRQLQQAFKISNSINSHSTNDQYCIQEDKLPSYIPTRVANKILFIGESVQMFESDIYTSALKPRNKGIILHGKEAIFARDLHHLSGLEVFDFMAFESTIDKIRSYVAEQLWRLIVEETDLPGHLRIMKDFYLLGRGELFLAFIDRAKPLLRPIPTGTTEHDINMAFQQAARNVLLEDEALLQRFRLTVDTGVTPPEARKDSQSKQQQKGSASDGTDKTDSGWNLLKLMYRVEWPLHILFTPNVIERYNSLFHFLLYVKRIQLELQQCWALQMQGRHMVKTADQSVNPWWLRNHMAFLIDNLQYYLQVDVIESQFSLLLANIQKTPDFEEIRCAHDTFLTSLLSQSFLMMKPIANCLSEILELCHRFSGLMMKAEVAVPDQHSDLLQDITKSFQRQSNLLFRFLSSVRSHQASPHLAQLLLRIDYNKYFTASGGQLGNYQAATANQSTVLSSRRR